MFGNEISMSGCFPTQRNKKLRLVVVTQMCELSYVRDHP